MTVENRTRRSTRLSNRLIAFGLALVALAAYVLIAVRTHYGAL